MCGLWFSFIKLDCRAKRHFADREMFRVGLRKSFSNQRLVEPVAKNKKQKTLKQQENNETILLKANQIEQVQLLKTG